MSHWAIEVKTHDGWNWFFYQSRSEIEAAKRADNRMDVLAVRRTVQITETQFHTGLANNENNQSRRGMRPRGMRKEAV